MFTYVSLHFIQTQGEVSDQNLYSLLLVYIWYVYNNLWQERGFTCCFVMCPLT